MGRKTTEERLPATARPNCGSNAGYGAHIRAGEYACDPCGEAHREHADSYTPPDDAAAVIPFEDPMLKVTSRPKLRDILALHVKLADFPDPRVSAVQCACGEAVKSMPDHVIVKLAEHNYGDHAEALEEAARKCLIRNSNHVPAEAVRAWLYGRALLIRGTI